MNKFKIILSFVIIGSVLSCGFLRNKVEEKVNEKVNETIDDQRRKIDSIKKSINPDSLDKYMKQLDSLQKQIDNNSKKNNK